MESLGRFGRYPGTMRWVRIGRLVFLALLGGAVVGAGGSGCRKRPAAAPGSPSSPERSTDEARKGDERSRAEMVSSVDLAKAGLLELFMQDGRVARARLHCGEPFDPGFVVPDYPEWSCSADGRCVASGDGQSVSFFMSPDHAAARAVVVETSATPTVSLGDVEAILGRDAGACAYLRRLMDGDEALIGNDVWEYQHPENDMSGDAPPPRIRHHCGDEARAKVKEHLANFQVANLLGPIDCWATSCEITGVEWAVLLAYAKQTQAGLKLWLIGSDYRGEYGSEDEEVAALEADAQSWKRLRERAAEEKCPEP